MEKDLKTGLNNQKLKQNRYYKNIIGARTYANVPLWLTTQFDLSILDVVLFSIIDTASRNARAHTYCSSIERLCTLVNATKPTVRTSLARLDSLGFIRKQRKSIKSSTSDSVKNWVCYTSAVDVQKLETPLTEQLAIELLIRNPNAADD